MAEITLVAEPERVTGTSASKRMRAGGRIPAVVYGGGMDALSVSVDARQLRQALSGESGIHQLLSLEVGPAKHLTLARVIQRHPVRNTVIHVDFQVVRRDEILSAEVSIVLIGESKSVEQERGVIEQPLQSLTVHATPSDIPNEIVVDLADLEIGDTVRVGDLKLPTGVTTEVDRDEPVVIAAVSAVAAEAEELAEEEAAEAAAAEAEAGEEGGTESGASEGGTPTEEG
ncbi:MAG: 50S ribosomal protein L25 [Actinomycetota bacterium]|nr:50S ribosomal protein L25 [Actinomycetota bacterium]